MDLLSLFAFLASCSFAGLLGFELSSSMNSASAKLDKAENVLKAAENLFSCVKSEGLAVRRVQAKKASAKNVEARLSQATALLLRTVKAFS